MGQKVNPISLRIGINKKWDSRWTHKVNYSEYLEQDLGIRSFIEDLCSYQDIGIGNISIWRTCMLKTLDTAFGIKNDAKPSILIYSQVYIPIKIHVNNTTTALKQEWLRNFENSILNHLEDRYHTLFNIGIVIDPIYEDSNRRIKTRNEVDTNMNMDLTRWLLNKDCSLIAQWIATSFQKRKGLKELCKNIDRCFESIQEEHKDSKFKLYGIKITCSGRFKLTDNEKRRNKMARIKTYKKGQIPLQTLSKHVNYYAATAYTPDGTSGIKVWISYEPSITI